MEDDSSLFALSVDHSAKTQLTEVARWARILAVTGITLLIIVIAKGIHSAYEVSQFEDRLGDAEKMAGAYSIGIIIGYTIMAFIPLLPLIFIFRLANKMKMALETNDQSVLTSSFQTLKIYFRYMAIVTIIMLVLIALSLFLNIVGRATF